jgi:hypothetical protein
MKTVEMIFEKTDNIKKVFSKHKNITVRETKKFYRVTLSSGTTSESTFKKLPEYVTTRNF